MADALAAGHAIRGALVAAAQAGGPAGATGRELRDAVRALELGERTEVVLERLRARAADPGWDTLVAAILLQRDAGGDLAALLRAIARERSRTLRRLEADARPATATRRSVTALARRAPCPPERPRSPSSAPRGFLAGPPPPLRRSGLPALCPRDRP
jgi:tight adherence protein B